MFKKFLLSLLFLGILSSCVVNTHNHGYEQNPDVFLKLKDDKSTKIQVLEDAGSPSIISTFNNDIWYYITTKTRRVSFFKPQVIESMVVQLNFSKEGRLSDIMAYSIKDNRKLEFDQRMSSIKGDDTSMLKDFFYNFGRFNKVEKKK
jgi:outer membrane protein assembly factor BamE (lipoprotein component of BamABCDE complex)